MGEVGKGRVSSPCGYAWRPGIRPEEVPPTAAIYIGLGTREAGCLVEKWCTRHIALNPEVAVGCERLRMRGGVLEWNIWTRLPAYRLEWLAEFEAAARRPLAERMKYAFIKTYKPVMDDARFRAFDTMEDYRQWCERELPEWLGYRRCRST